MIFFFFFGDASALDPEDECLRLKMNLPFCEMWCEKRQFYLTLAH